MVRHEAAEALGAIADERCTALLQVWPSLLPDSSFRSMFCWQASAARSPGRCPSFDA